MTNDEYLARAFSALSHPRRAMVFRHLTDTAKHGATYQELQGLTGLADSSLIHHLRTMERAGLLRRQRMGPVVAYRLTPGDFLRLSRLAQSMITRPSMSEVA